jgi:rRNA small subunit pseudouridine methyltransferase Nep1
MLIIVLADAELELLLGGHFGGSRGCFSQTIPVLDSFIHRELGQSLPGERRGRPDIVHMSLTLCQGSILNRRGLLRTYVHTRDDKVIAIDPHAEIPPNYLEFLEVFGKVLQGLPVQGYTLEDLTLQELVRDVGADLVIALDPEGEPEDLQAVIRYRSPRSVAMIIGAFPSGDFTSPVRDLADFRVSLGSELLTVPTVLSEVLSSFPR